MLPRRSDLAVPSPSAAASSAGVSSSSVKSFKFKRSILSVQRAWRVVMNHKPIREHASVLMQTGVGIAEADLKSIR